MNTKPLLLLQFRTDKSRAHEEKVIRKRIGYAGKRMEVINVLDDTSIIPGPSDLDKYSAVFTGASGQFNVTDWNPQVEKRVMQTTPFLREVVRRDTPMLAICFGHQMFAHILGGMVMADPDKAETGTLEITQTNEGGKSPLFKGIPKHFFAVVGHKDSVVRLPKYAVLLASSDKCRVQSYRLGNNIYTTQFHPELDRDDLLWRLSLYPEYLKGKNIEELKSQFNPIPHTTKLLNNFINLVEEYWSDRV